MSKILLNIDSKLHKEFKIATTKNETTMTQAIIEFIKNYIERNEDEQDN